MCSLKPCTATQVEVKGDGLPTIGMHGDSW